MSNTRQNVFLYFFSLFIFAIIAYMQSGPGYMDADYYYLNAREISSSQIGKEPFLWNYLNEPSSLPGPAYLYWMPLTSILTYLGMILTGRDAFLGARIILLVLAALIPPISSSICQKLSGNQKQGLLAGLFAVFSGFYLPFITTTDAFGIFMVLGGIYLLLIFKIYTESEKWWIWGGIGLITGLMHLCRADGIIWLGASVLLIFFMSRRYSAARTIAAFLGVGLGYLLVMGPWYLRNMLEFNALFPPGNSKTLWLTNYDEIFAFPSTHINLETWLASGWMHIFQARLWAFGQNIQTSIAVQGAIYLFPFILIGIYHTRRHFITRFGILIWLMIFILMTFLWPYSGVRGSYYHSAAGIQPLLWAVIPLGMEVAIVWMAKKRKWNLASAVKVLTTGFVTLALLFSGFLTYRSLDIGTNRPWGYEVVLYSKIEDYLLSIDPQKKSVVMVNNPPGFTLAADRPSIVIPSGSPDKGVAAAKKFGAEYLLLEPDTNYPDIYRNPTGQDIFQYLNTIENVHIFKFNQEP